MNMLEIILKSIIREEINKVVGGLSDDSSLNDIAKKHNVSIDSIKHQLKLGIAVEMEHTNDKKIAKEIAMDHLVELPDYYTRLKKIETFS